MFLFSCRRYEVKGDIDNEDFIGSWIHVISFSVNDTYIIRANGKFEEKSYNREASGGPRTQNRKGKVQIEGNSMSLEYLNRLGDNNIEEFTVVVPPTMIDTFYYDNYPNLYDSTPCSGFAVVFDERLAYTFTLYLE
jgi:hypothetical protein